MRDYIKYGLISTRIAGTTLPMNADPIFMDDMKAKTYKIGTHALGITDEALEATTANPYTIVNAQDYIDAGILNMVDPVATRPLAFLLMRYAGKDPLEVIEDYRAQQISAKAELYAQIRMISALCPTLAISEAGLRELLVKSSVEYAVCWAAQQQLSLPEGKLIEYLTLAKFPFLKED